MKLKKTVYLMLIIAVLCSSISIPVRANESTFSFELSVDDQEEKTVKTGDIITVFLKLKRTDSLEPYMMYAMQDEIRYDSTFFELVDGSVMLNNGITTKNVSLTDEYKELYMNYLSMSGGNTWDAETIVGSFQLKVIGETGVSKISNQDYLVSLKDGSGSFPCKANEINVYLTTECVVRFVTNGGSEIEDQIVAYNDKIKRPEDPKKDGYQLEGWYKDIHLTDEWDFDRDVVQNNMTLYTKWSEDSASDNQNLQLIICILIIIICIFIKYKLRKKQQHVQKD